MTQQGARNGGLETDVDVHSFHLQLFKETRSARHHGVELDANEEMNMCNIESLVF